MRTQAQKRAGDLLQVVPDVICQQIQIANLYFIGLPGSVDWVLVDAGMGKGSVRRIREAAESLYGRSTRPNCILLTHGHFDHVGGLPELAEHWDVPVFAHELEIPYLSGLSSYPPPDPTVGGGAMARLSMLYPRGPVDLGGRVVPLPRDHSVPGLVGWRWLHTPGHTHGHVSFFRDADGVLIAGDAFVTTRQESALAALTQKPEVNGPPRYYTSDWQAARRSVELLAALRPNVAATGHGLPLAGPDLRQDLERLALEFATRAVPRRGRYVRKPALADRSGVIHVPRPVVDPVLLAVGGIALGALVGTLVARRRTAAVPLQPVETLPVPVLESPTDDMLLSAGPPRDPDVAHLEVPLADPYSLPVEEPAPGISTLLEPVPFDEPVALDEEPPLLTVEDTVAILDGRPTVVEETVLLLDEPEDEPVALLDTASPVPPEDSPTPLIQVLTEPARVPDEWRVEEPPPGGVPGTPEDEEDRPSV